MMKGRASKRALFYSVGRAGNLFQSLLVLEIPTKQRAMRRRSKRSKCGKNLQYSSNYSSFHLVVAGADYKCLFAFSYDK